MRTLKDLKIIFLGTPDFAVASLDALHKAGANVVAVVTAPDKPSGRGLQLQSPAVKKYAEEHGIPVLQPLKLKDPEFIEQLRSYHADLQVVVAFRMLPVVVWDMPPLGTINVHASLLPQYRGAAPINWAVINGETETGVTTFKLKHEIDTGDILLQESFPIGENETAGEVHDKMKEIGAQLLVKTVQGLIEGDLKETTQESLLKAEGEMQNADIQHSAFSIQHSALKHAPKIFTADCKIDWTKTTDEIHNLIRGLSPFPGAFTELGDKTIKIFQSEKEHIIPTTKPGRWESNKSTYLKFACKDGYIHLKDVQLEGKKRMNIEDFLRGYRI